MRFTIRRLSGGDLSAFEKDFKIETTPTSEIIEIHNLDALLKLGEMAGNELIITQETGSLPLIRIHDDYYD